jgi:hypothetical protein
MQIKFQTTKKDYIEFNHSHLKKLLRNRIAVLGIFSFLVAITAAGKIFDWYTFFATLILFSSSNMCANLFTVFLSNSI